MLFRVWCHQGVGLILLVGSWLQALHGGIGIRDDAGNNLSTGETYLWRCLVVMRAFWNKRAIRCGGGLLRFSATGQKVS